MTSYYKGNNIGLNYDAANATWSFNNEPNDFIDPDSFSTADPAFDYTPPPSTDDDEDDDFNPCPAGYIYDSTLKQCVPDPNQQTSYQQDTGDVSGGDYAKEAQENYVDFREMSYDKMVDFGKKKGFFNEAGTFIGAPKSEVPFPFLKGIAQFGLDSQANRFAINFAKKGGKIWNPLESSFIGNLYIPKRDDLARLIAGTDIASDFNKKIHNFETATLNTASNYANYLKESGIGGIRDEQEKERLRKAKFDADISAEKAKREMQKTIAEAEEREKTKSELEDLQAKKDKERKDIKTEKDKRDMQETIRKAEKAQQVKEEYRDKGQVTYKPKETGGYVTTPNRPSAPPGERGGGGYVKSEPKKYERPGTSGAPGYHW